MKTQSIYLALVIVLLCPGATAQWIQTNGPMGGEVYSLVVSSANLFAGTYRGGVFLTTNNGTTWTAVNTGLTDTRVNALAVSPASGGSGTNLFAGTSGGIFLSTNNGTSWTAASTGLANTSVHALAVSPASGGSGTSLFAGTFGGGIFLSTNNGTSWTEINTGLTNTRVAALAVSPASGGTGGTNLFAATAGGGVFLSTNNGSNWAEVNTGLTNPYVPALAVSPASGGSGTNLFAGTYDGVFLSTDNGTSWTQTGVTNTVVTSFAVSPASGGSGTNFFAGTAMNGIFLSTNNGTSWTPVSYGFAPGGAWSFAVYGPNLFAGTFNGGVWRRPLSEMITSVERLSTDLPTHFSLDQNYPNPFNPSTTIQFSIPNTSFVSLKVFNVLGAEIATLVNENKPSGTFQVAWNANGYPSSVYFYRLLSAGKVFTGKMNLVK